MMHISRCFIFSQFQMIVSLEGKFAMYSRRLEEMAEVVEDHYSVWQQQQQTLGIDRLDQCTHQSQYRPCCLIPDNYLQLVALHLFGLG